MSSIVSRRPPVLGVDEPVERLLLDVDEVGDLEDVVEPRERAARTGSINGSQDGDSSWTGERATGGALRATGRGGRRAQKARPAKIAQGEADPCEGRSALTDPVRPGLRMWRRGRCGRLRLSADWQQCIGGVKCGRPRPKIARTGFRLPRPGDGAASRSAAYLPRSPKRPHRASPGESPRPLPPRGDPSDRCGHGSRLHARHRRRPASTGAASATYAGASVDVRRRGRACRPRAPRSVRR